MNDWGSLLSGYPGWHSTYSSDSLWNLWLLHLRHNTVPVGGRTDEAMATGVEAAAASPAVIFFKAASRSNEAMTVC